MLTTRKLALFSVIAAMLLVVGLQQSSANDTDVLDMGRDVVLSPVVSPGATWCEDICDANCGGECDSARSVGCTCRWICERGERGTTTCGAPMAVRICPAGIEDLLLLPAPPE